MNMKRTLHFSVYYSRGVLSWRKKDQNSFLSFSPSNIQMIVYKVSSPDTCSSQIKEAFITQLMRGYGYTHTNNNKWDMLCRVRLLPAQQQWGLLCTEKTSTSGPDTMRNTVGQRSHNKLFIISNKGLFLQALYTHAPFINFVPSGRSKLTNHIFCVQWLLKM